MNKPEDIIKTTGFYSAPVHGMSMYPLLYNHRDSVYIVKPENLKNMMWFCSDAVQINLYSTEYLNLAQTPPLCAEITNTKKKL